MTQFSRPRNPSNNSQRPKMWHAVSETAFVLGAFDLSVVRRTTVAMSSYTENLRTSSDAPVPDKGEESGAKGNKAPILSPASPLKSQIPIKQLVAAVESSSDDTGWAQLSQVGNVLGRMVSDFDTRSFGFSNLTALMTAVDSMEVERRPQENGHTRIFVRKKPSELDERTTGRSKRPLRP
ncbi:hypothetical protein E6C67_03055 (plasmid) [Azospirillum sp. TSA2s]|uniref:OST-HTH/LOTUS domain-containing protein n=1 Tax=Azospirillum sp. TSA2s TaxID=709810 RepID=UPI0010AA9DC3|nr:OST-HTH/LOTUS domain-containing protein [Azospirillum sp. TSA2s]QCG92944.1 hypothetical protein E6C67_03055 [Azospirillum sp. TSA2s]